MSRHPYSNSKNTIRICINCGREFTYKYKITGLKCCSSECTKKNIKKLRLRAINEYIGRNPLYARKNRKTI
jgi:hypothetical protein